MPAESVAATLKACGPTAKLEYAAGLVQAALAPSSVQRNLAPDSDDVKAKDAVVAVVGFEGCAVIVVSGGVVPGVGGGGVVDDARTTSCSTCARNVPKRL